MMTTLEFTTHVGMGGVGSFDTYDGGKAGPIRRATKILRAALRHAGLEKLQVKLTGRAFGDWVWQVRADDADRDDLKAAVASVTHVVTVEGRINEVEGCYSGEEGEPDAASKSLFM